MKNVTITTQTLIIELTSDSVCAMVQIGFNKKIKTINTLTNKLLTVDFDGKSVTTTVPMSIVLLRYDQNMYGVADAPPNGV